MIALRVEIAEYDKESNTCKGILLNGDIIVIDPFVYCAIPLSDEDYEAGKGGDIVGNVYILTIYDVTKDGVYPNNGGMIEL